MAATEYVLVTGLVGLLLTPAVATLRGGLERAFGAAAASLPAPPPIDLGPPAGSSSGASHTANHALPPGHAVSGLGASPGGGVPGAGAPGASLDTLSVLAGARPVAAGAVSVSVPSGTLLRAGPGAGAASLGPLPVGAELTYLESRDDGWSRVRDANGRVGWIESTPPKSRRGEIVLRFTPVGGATRYRIYYGTAPRSYGPPLEIPGDQAVARLTGLEPGARYYVAVTTVAGALESELSEEKTVEVKQ